jgi:peptidyl-prolyl cis-trans isomerase C
MSDGWTLDTVLVTVNGESQPAERAELLLREQIARGAHDTPALREGVRQALVDDALMAQAAMQAGLDQISLVRAQIGLARQNILAQAWQQFVLAEQAISEEQLRAEHARQAPAPGAQEVRVRHLVARDEDTALDWLRRIGDGETMESLAAESHDAATAGSGGLADWMAMDRLLPAIAQALHAKTPGERLEHPVLTPSGWHVLKLEARRSPQAPRFEDVRPQLIQAIAHQRLLERLQGLRDRASVV